MMNHTVVNAVPGNGNQNFKLRNQHIHLKVIINI